MTSEGTILRFAGVLISGVGIYLYWRPAYVAEKIMLFYSRYPILRYAGEEQLTSRSGLVRLVGVVFVIVGVICVFSV